MFKAKGMNHDKREIVIVVENNSGEDQLMVTVAPVVAQPINEKEFSEVQYWARPVVLHMIKANGKCAVPFEASQFTDGPDVLDVTKGGEVEVAIQNKNGEGFSDFPLEMALRK